MTAVLALDDVTFRRDGNQIIDGISLTVKAGEHWALLGGRTVAAGDARATVTTETVSAAFDHPVTVGYAQGRWTARAKVTRIIEP